MTALFQAAGIRDGRKRFFLPAQRENPVLIGADFVRDAKGDFLSRHNAREHEGGQIELNAPLVNCGANFGPNLALIDAGHDLKFRASLKRSARRISLDQHDRKISRKASHREQMPRCGGDGKHPRLIGEAVAFGHDMPVADDAALLRGNTRGSQSQITDRRGDGRSGAHEGHSVPPEFASHHARIFSRGKYPSLPADAAGDLAGMAGASPGAMPAIFSFERQRASIVPALLVLGLALCVAAVLAEAVL